MLIFTLALRNLLRHPVKTVLIGSLIAVGTGLLFVANAVFESSTDGMEASFVGSLTGDFAIGAKTEELIGLFGSEVPIVSEYEGIPPLSDFGAVDTIMAEIDRVAAWTPVVSAAAQVKIGRFSITAPVFGVDYRSYFEVLDDLRIVEGDPAALASGGVFLNEAMRAAAEKTLKRKLNVNETITFSMYSNGSFRIRKGVFAGVYRYPAPNEALDRVVLTDPVLVRALANYTLGYATADRAAPAEPTGQAEAAALDSLDDLFADAADLTDAPSGGVSLEAVEADLADTRVRDTLVLTDDAAWSFVLVRTEHTAARADAERDASRRLREAQAEARVLSWRTAAGTSALMLFAVRIAFTIGIGFLILGAVLVVMNALVIAVLERSGEIGSMRALGASRGFIRALFIMETMLLTLAAALVGVATGTAICASVAVNGIPLNNALLASLFGGNVVRPRAELGAALAHVAGAAVIGSLAWIYPVAVALKIQPVHAMVEK